MKKSARKQGERKTWNPPEKRLGERGSSERHKKGRRGMSKKEGEQTEGNQGKKRKLGATPIHWRIISKQ